MGGNSTKVSLPNIQLPDNFTAIITGGSAGLGYEVGKYIVFMGGRVILAGGSEIRAKAATLRMKADFIELMEELRQNDADSNTLLTPKATLDAELKVEFMELDLRSLESVQTFVKDFRQKNYPLHLLLCNAAVVNAPQGKTVDGFETNFQVNYLGHFLLTLNFLPILQDSGEDTRVINVTSSAHTSGEFNMSNIQGKQNYSKSKFYANSKLYQIMSMFALCRRLEDKGVSFYSLHPGGLEEEIKKTLDHDSTLWKDTYNISRNIGSAMGRLAVGVNTCMKIAVDPSMKELNGTYFSGGIPVAPLPKSNDVKAQEVLWKYSIDCLKNYVTKEMLEDLVIDLEDLGVIKPSEDSHNKDTATDTDTNAMSY